MLEVPTLRLVETKRARAIESFLFDGTTDLGVPVVLSLDLRPDGEVLLNVSAHPLVTAAAEHCVRETYMHSTASGWAFPGRSRGHLRDADYRLCEAARFLVDAHRSGAARAPANLPGEGDVEWIAAILERLAEKSIRAVAVELTTAELSRVGLVAAKVIVPKLQPYSWHDAAQFRAHPRLADGVKAMGYPPRSSSELNRLSPPLA